MSNGYNGLYNFEDEINCNNRHEIRQALIDAFAHLKPSVLRQILYQPMLVNSRFKTLVQEILLEKCSRFAQHSQQWTYNQRQPDLLTRMIQYDKVWEGFPSNDPWFNSKDQNINYFMDRNHALRIEELDFEFYRGL